MATNPDQPQIDELRRQLEAETIKRQELEQRLEAASKKATSGDFPTKPTRNEGKTAICNTYTQLSRLISQYGDPVNSHPPGYMPKQAELVRLLVEWRQSILDHPQLHTVLPSNPETLNIPKVARPPSGGKRKKKAEEEVAGEEAKEEVAPPAPPAPPAPKSAKKSKKAAATPTVDSAIEDRARL